MFKISLGPNPEQKSIFLLKILAIKKPSKLIDITMSKSDVQENNLI